MATVTASAYSQNGNSLLDMSRAQILTASTSSTSSSSSSLSSIYQAHSNPHAYNPAGETPAPSSDNDSVSLMDDNASLYPALFCRAKYDYVAQDASALSFQTGDIIEVLTQQPSGWWDGLLNDERGWFPSNYVTIISEEEAEREFEERYGAQNQNVQNQIQLGALGQGHGPVMGASTQIGAASASASVSASASASSSGNRLSVVDMGQALMGSASSSGAEDAELWLANAMESDVYAPSASANAPPSASDFWMPQVASNGQIFYVNTKTGEQSRDLPVESDDDISSDSDLGGIAHSRGFGGDQLNHLNQLGHLTSTSSIPGSHLSFGPLRGSAETGGGGGAAAAVDPTAGGFGVPRKTGTPEPWIRRLADDGLSYYYLNKVDGTVQWTRPEPTTTTQPQTPTTAVPAGVKGRGGSNNNPSNVRPTSVYSDTSDIHPLDGMDRGSPRRRGHAHSNSATTATATAVDSSLGHQDLGMTSQLTSAEIIAHELQKALVPPPPESPLELAAAARDAIQAIVFRLRLESMVEIDVRGGSGSGAGAGGGAQTEGELHKDLDRQALLAMEGMDDLIAHVVQTVRNLLYVSAVPTTSIPSTVLPKGYTPPFSNQNPSTSTHPSSSTSTSRTHDRTHSHSSSHPNAPLKPGQRKVTATLSRLVLSARAITYDAGTVSPSDTASRIGSDAEELDKAVAAFMGDIQKLGRVQVGQPREFQQLGRKRLKGAFDARNLGLGLPGAGAAGGWSGFGWVETGPESGLDAGSGTGPGAGADVEVKKPTKVLSMDVISEIAASLTRLDVLIGVLVLAVRAPDGPAGVGSGSGALLQDQESSMLSTLQIHGFAKDVVGQVQVVLDLVGEVDVAESVVIDTPQSNLTSNSNLSIGMGHDSTSSSEGLLSSSSSSMTLDSLVSSSTTTSKSLTNMSNGSTIMSSTLGDHPSTTTLGAGMGTTINETYTRALLSARVLLRTLETALQSLFDDAASLFHHVQLLRMDPLSSIHSIGSPSSSSTVSSSVSLHHERELSLDMINVLCTSLKANSAVMVQTMERLLTVGAEQRDAVGVKEWEGGVRFSREVSRRSLVRSSMFGFGMGGGVDIGGRPSSVLRAPVGAGAGYGGFEYPELPELRSGFNGMGEAPDDELGLEDAFSRPQRPLRMEPNRYQGPQGPDVYGVPASQLHPNAGVQPFASPNIPQRPIKALPIPGKPNVIPPQATRAESGYGQRNGMGYAGAGAAAAGGDAYRDVSQQGYASESEPGSYGMTSSASEGEDGYDVGEEEEEEEEGFLGDGAGGDPLTPKTNGPGQRHNGKPKISSKVAKILGEEAPPWFLLPNEGGQDKDIVVDSDKSVKGGTVQALVERLTAHDQTDPNYTKAFLMTFKSFTTLDELFDLLVQRFKIQPPRDLAPLELRQWTSKKKNIVQFRVINTFKSMLTDEDILEKEDLYILDRMKEFVLSEDVAQVSASRPLLTLIERVQKSGETKRIVVKAAQTAPIPIVPKGISLTSASFPSITGSKKLKLTDIDSLELARQLTLFESTLYQKIRPMECLQRAREGSKGDRGEGGAMDNIALVIQTSNRIADWVADCVLSKEDSKKRAATVKHLILVADRCRTLNNFSTMIAIVSGLNTPPIRRLKRTWEQVSQRHMAQFGACEVTLDSNKNFNKYRSMLASVVPPCVPFIGVFLSTLQFIQDGNKDFLSDGMVNFKKRQMASEVISDIKRWQAHSYNLQLVPAIRDYIEESLSAFDDTDRDRFWQMSLEREPREREDEKMARLLQESGFL
ncbi:hypothetical protein GYMLUDRAFT_44664 [Collybiopsis luxurians FD-317 M1]|uniref:Ras GEF n=1 Tax=Collybiopsis luxurians FD-317 M1 TaxID=944289 RepID=A0A0D0CU08_9AGAR|nr:hypothetical protein GYMLUDRAFT_44664 [Collybiopsis luxurians FD-317 M1]